MKFQGKTGLLWFTGIVEDRNDPLFLNRVRVRIYGAHTHDKQFIATPDLPWSTVLMPTTSPSLSGLGTTTHGLVEGSTVMGFWRDDYEMQDPVIIGSFIGIPQSFYRIDETIDDQGTRNFTQIERTTEEGFNDPRLEDAESYEGTPDGPNPKHINRNYGLTLDLKNSPKSAGTTAAVSYPKEDYLGLSDVNLMARVTEDSPMEDAYPIIAEVDGEPTRSNYVKPVYPFNHVHETESGHVIELDDTPDAERIHAYHRSGTRVEVDKDGTYVEKIVRDKYTLILGSDTVKIQGAVDIEVGDSIAVNAIAAAGGVDVLAAASTADIVGEDGTFTDATKTKLKDAGVTDEEIATAEKEGKIEEIIITATKKGLDYDDVENKTNVSTVVGLVEGVDQGDSGVASVVTQVSKELGGDGLSTEAETVLTDALNEAKTEGISIKAGLSKIKSKLSKVSDLTSKVVDKIQGKVTAILDKATASIEGLKAKVTEKVTAAVSEVFGEKAAAAVGEQMAGAISGVALGAVMGAFGSPLVNIKVAGGAKVTTQGNTDLLSLGSTNVTAAISTTVTSPTVNILAIDINSTGIWNHTGAMNIVGATTIKGATLITGKTGIVGATTITGATVITPTLQGADIYAPIIRTVFTTLAGHTHTATGPTAPTTPPIPGT